MYFASDVPFLVEIIVRYLIYLFALVCLFKKCLLILFNVALPSEYNALYIFSSWMLICYGSTRWLNLWLVCGKLKGILYYNVLRREENVAWVRWIIKTCGLFMEFCFFISRSDRSGEKIVG